MTVNPCLARIRGLPYMPSVTQINVRSGPGTNHKVAFKGTVGLDNLLVTEVQPDNEGKALNNKVYQWFHLQFPDNTTGWVRDDLLDIRGDCQTWGYEDTLPPETFAFALTRADAPAAKQPETPAAPDDTPTMTREAGTIDVAEDIPVDNNIDRIKKAAFAVTAAFEGSGYAAYNNYDAGIVSYGLIQFTLAAGSLAEVIDRYLEYTPEDSPNADGIKGYQSRIQARDASLRNDNNLRTLLINAAQEPTMQQAQDEVATIRYWDTVVDGYITHRELKLPLSYALLFDMGVNFGTGHAFVRLAEDELGVPRRSKPGENGITEQQLIAKVAEFRKRSHDRQAARDNLPGLRVRGDFWVNLANEGDWDFAGNKTGFVNVNGRWVNVRQP